MIELEWLDKVQRNFSEDLVQMLEAAKVNIVKLHSRGLINTSTARMILQRLDVNDVDAIRLFSQKNISNEEAIRYIRSL